MGKLILGVLSKCPQQDVFDFLSDPANLSKWSSALDATEWNPATRPVSVRFIVHQGKGSDLIRSSHEQANPIDYRNY
jgi:hypothetical protein